MVGGMARRTPPRELARDPETWPHAELTDPGATVIQVIARALANALKAQKRSLRQTAIGAGVNRQAIADLLAGRCWPDVATVARLENFLAVPLYPPRSGTYPDH
ncbi:helix-turn-helix transcriptional regulator [Streptomyces tauricus]|uniref:helix-turn-helix transcriptional regulator n=1 Tax=Streptomyces tauricus TaxID=68274 RepID=UPI0033DD8ED8